MQRVQDPPTAGDEVLSHEARVTSFDLFVGEGSGKPRAVQVYRIIHSILDGVEGIAEDG